MKYAGIIIILSGFIFLFVQNKYYGYVDDQGVVQDSLFLPLGAIFIILGIILLVFIFIKSYLKK